MTAIKTMWDFLESLEEDYISPIELRNENEAERALSQYKSICADIADAEKHAEEYLVQAQKDAALYLERTRDPLLDRKTYLEERLRIFAESKIEGTKKKSFKLVGGTLQFTKQQDKYERNDELLLEELQEKDCGVDFLKPQPPKIDWVNLKKELDIIPNEDGTSSVFFWGKKLKSVTVETNLPPKFSIK